MDIALHLGAHKTATTYLQTRLMHSMGTLRRAGVYYVPLPDLRSGPTRLLTRGLRPGIGGYLAQREFRLAMDVLMRRARDAGAWRLCLSDENLIGTCGDVVERGHFYRRARGTLSQLADSLDDYPVRIFLAVRNYADFFGSAYGQVVRQGRYQPFDGAMKARLMRAGRGWPELVSDISAAFPDATLCVWAYEDLAMVEPMVLSRMLGRGATTSLAAFDERPMIGLSGAAMSEIDALSLSGAPDSGQISAAIRRSPRSRRNPGFNPWTAAERVALDERYRHDLDVIDALFPGALSLVPAAA